MEKKKKIQSIYTQLYCCNHMKMTDKTITKSYTFIVIHVPPMFQIITNVEL